MSPERRAVVVDDISGGPNSTRCLSGCRAREASRFAIVIVILLLTERISVRGGRVSLIDIQLG